MRVEGVVVQWSDLPHDLLSRITNGLGPIDFLSFCGVCKDWRVASSKSSPQGNSLGCGDSWATIELPNCPFAEVTTEHVAALSSPPTSQDCIVAVLNRISDSELELFMLRRGENQWVQAKHSLLRIRFNTVRAALFHEGEELHFLDGDDNLVTFNASKTKQWEEFRLSYAKTIFNWRIIKKKLKVGLLEANVSISTRGTVIPHAGGELDMLIQSESIEPATHQSESRHHRKGVWIQPRYFYVPPGQKWVTSKVDSATYNKMTGEWSNLPHDLLSRISSGLGLIDFLSFRGVCKDWRVVSSKVSSEVKQSLGCDPWFLVYEEGEDSHSQCSLLSHQDQLYTINIPELDGATCLASYEGWLLLFRHGSLFFFSPFSRATIELPNCPFAEATDEHVAAFSSPPTSQNCIVAVVNRISDSELELFMLRRGESVWATRCCHGYKFKTMITGLFCEGKEFHFLDLKNGLAIFDSETKEWNKNNYRIRCQRSSRDISASSLRALRYVVRKNVFQNKSIRTVGLLLDDENVSISTCGTAIPHASVEFDQIVIKSESIEAAKQPESRHLKGVWIQPIYLCVPPGQTW
ncbi:F-box protein [Glycine soja]